MVEREEGCVAVSAREERRGVFCWDTTQPYRYSCQLLVIPAHAVLRGQEERLTTFSPPNPNNRLASHTTCTRLGSTLTAPSGTSGSVNDNALTNVSPFLFFLAPPPPSFPSNAINPAPSSTIRCNPLSWQNSNNSRNVSRG